MAEQIIIALVLGLVEGLTEFIPVSSTGHLILLGHFLGFKEAATFDVLIQLGAILAILLVYFNRLVQIAKALPVSVKARHFVLAVLFGFLPAAVIGALAHDFIKTVLFDSPQLICISLILGGIVLLVIDKIQFKPKYTSAYEFSWPMAIKIGFFQCLAMIPGTSRSGSTIVGALLLGADKRSAAEFSFFLAMPTMAGAFALDLWKSRHDLSTDQGLLIVIGFVTAFISALLVVRALLDFVSRRGYAPFAWWRIAVGTLGLIGLYTIG
ncbi:MULTISPECIES: undecaprenyl-diphosphate phosphatase [Rhizobium]|jgi:undecaprenyl-diphosphatase|uniref:Undecaprenyl-diphosphatase n=1 Tax=Rhizobium lusitanum TaxID=293958 RepID=A0A1C3W5X5_9HYPH|nr:MULTISPECIES: undecaprenyl-diphosphate phosphatase [Rhizobium]NRP84219.1 Undecaprenyl-diphosphatase [Ensifer adhaerens]NKJ04971.1 undecaprenyl-diphosphatase [Rhizobium sp. SG741]NKJ36228.1 undecaprenyl-diphosphatase [Rhizobium sp. SG570]NTJ05714.1 undecaprenyl-diphosphate phosphatase [Rhizobium lusitanum]SCB35218.1 undecaprenyl-diphosphatase [Rhizobium lusitanum]